MWGEYTHEGERYVYTSKPKRVADWAERRPLERCPHCDRHQLAHHRRVDRTGLVLTALRLLFGGRPARRVQVTEWDECRYCHWSGNRSQEVRPRD